ncbi:MAG TPA: hypothetical protein VMR62_37635 [Bryobacteraceae bacterium]|jgi:hypothetical protein|nr:hypothetical protein [Bryobacteraceae bacterium]
MKIIKRLGLRWLLPIVLAVVSASLFYYGAAQDRVALAKLERAGWHFGAAWHPHPSIQLAESLNLPAMLIGVILINWLPERVVDLAIFSFVVPLLGWVVGNWADNEFGLGRAQGRTPPPLHERTIMLSCCGAFLGIVLGIAFLGRFTPGLVGLFWIMLAPVSILTWAARWRRQNLRPRSRL